MSMSALPHMANPAAVGLGRERPVSGSDFFQSWPKWKHLVLIRASGCDSCSGSCEDLAVGCNADCGTRTKYTNISTVIMCQVKQAIEGSGWMCWEGVLSERARCVTWMQGDWVRPPTRQIRPSDFDRLQDIFLARANATDRIVILNTQWIEQYHVVLPRLVPVEEGALSSQDRVQRLGGWPKGLSNCEISDLCFFVVPGLYRHICKSTLAPVLEHEIWSLSDSMVQLKLLEKGGKTVKLMCFFLQDF